MHSSPACFAQYPVGVESKSSKQEMGIKERGKVSVLNHGGDVVSKASRYGAYELQLSENCTTILPVPGRGVPWSCDRDGSYHPMKGLGASSAGQALRQSRSQHVLLDTYHVRHWATASSRVHGWDMARATRGPIIDADNMAFVLDKRHHLALTLCRVSQTCARIEEAAVFTMPNARLYQSRRPSSLFEVLVHDDLSPFGLSCLP